MTPSGQLLEEHDGLHAILDDVAHLVRKGHLSSAAKVFGELRHVVELHSAIEERRLEDLEAHGRQLPGAERMRESHARLQAASRDAWEALTRHDPHECTRTLAALGGALAWHERQETELKLR